MSRRAKPSIFGEWAEMDEELARATAVRLWTRPTPALSGRRKLDHIQQTCFDGWNVRELLGEEQPTCR